MKCVHSYGVSVLTNEYDPYLHYNVTCPLTVIHPWFHQNLQGLAWPAVSVMLHSCLLDYYHRYITRRIPGPRCIKSTMIPGIIQYPSLYFMYYYQV